MNKTFRLTKGKHAPARVLDAVKSELNKHIKRERSKPLPKGIDFWDFDCKVGMDSETAKPVHVSAIAQAVDNAAEKSTTESIFVSIKTTGKSRNPAKPKTTAQPTSTEDA